MNIIHLSLATAGGLLDTITNSSALELEESDWKQDAKGNGTAESDSSAVELEELEWKQDAKGNGTAESDSSAVELEEWKQDVKGNGDIETAESDSSELEVTAL